MDIGEIRKDALANGIPVMKEDGIRFLTDLLRKDGNIRRVLEIGTAVGYSAICMAMVREDIVIDTVEIDPVRASEARKNIRACGMADRIYVHCCDGADYLTMTAYDLIFIDGPKSQYGRYLSHYMDNTHRGTVFVFDNLAFHGIVDDNSLSENRSTIQMAHKIKAFREALLNDERFKTDYYPEAGDGIAVAVRL